jgi:nucleoside-diphosphate-sugar epimerase
MTDILFANDFGPGCDWTEGLVDIDVVIHCLARSSVVSRKDPEKLADLRKVNVLGSLNLAEQAAAAGVKRFIFISSAKVNGEVTELDYAFTADDLAAPEDEYGSSKADAEAGLRRISNRSSMEVTIIRPPMVYGVGAKGNFATLVKWIRCGWPMPLGGLTENRRSFVAVDNLVDLILTTTEHPNAGNRTLMVSDGEDLSTADFICRLGEAIGRAPRMVVVPTNLLPLLDHLAGKPGSFRRLSTSLRLDIRATQELLGWRPIIGVDEGLRRAVSEER